MATVGSVLEDIRRAIRSMERELDSNDSQVQRLLAKNEVLKDRLSELQCIESNLRKVIEEEEQAARDGESEEDREAMSAFIKNCLLQILQEAIRRFRLNRWHISWLRGMA